MNNDHHFDIDAIRHAEELFKDKNENIISAAWISKINTRQSVDHRLIIFSESQMLLYKKPVLSKIPKLSRSYNWFDLQQVKFLNSQNIELTFQDNEVLTIQHELSSKILEIIYTRISQIMIPEEYPEFDIPNFDPSSLLLPKDALYLRFRALSFQMQLTPHATLVSFLQTLLKTKPSTITISEEIFKNVPDFELYYLIFLKSIVVCPFLHEIIFKPIGTLKCFHAIGIFITIDKYIDKIHFDCPIEDDFKSILDAFQNLPNRFISTLKFTHSITNSSIENISRISQYYPLKTYIFGESIKSALCNRFCQLISSTRYFTDIRSITFDHLSNRDLPSILETLAPILELQFLHPDFDISQFFGLIRKPLLSRSLNLSYSQCYHGPTNYVIPRYLSKLTLNNVLFSSKHLNYLFNLCFQLGNVDLSLCNIQTCDEDVFGLLFESLSNNTGDLHALRWDNNPIHDNLFKFLNDCDSLQILSLSGCLELSNLSTFCRFIAANKTIRQLFIRGTDSRKLSEKALSSVLDAIGLNRSLITIDLSHNKFDQNTWKQLATTLLQNRVIHELILDDIPVEDYENYKDCLITLRRRGTKLKINYPDELIQKVFQNDPNSRQRKDFKDLWIEIINGNPAISIPPENVSPNDLVFSLETPENSNANTSNTNNSNANNSSNNSSNNTPVNNSVEKGPLKKPPGIPRPIPVPGKDKKLQNENEERYHPEEVDASWDFTIQPLPQPDISNLISQYAQKYTFDSLIEQVRAH